MPRLPRVSGKELVRALEQSGWTVVRVRGSHHQLRHPERTALVTVPVHGNETVGVKTLTSILRQATMTADELRELL